MHGYDTKEELIGRTAIELIAERDHVAVMKTLKESLKTGSIGITRCNFVARDGSEFPAMTSSGCAERCWLASRQDS